MTDLLTLPNLVTLGLLTLLQAVLGFDNLLYISLESKRAPANDQPKVRTLGIGIAIFLRIALLFLLVSVIDYFQKPIFGINIDGWVESHFNIHSLIVLLGGVFIMYTAMKEIWHMIKMDEHEKNERKAASTNQIIALIVIMNVVFSFDSILSAMALTDVLPVMTLAIIIGGLLMIKLAGTVSAFLEKNRLYEVLGLFILFVVGIMLLSEGGHLAHISFKGNPITPMSKATFYFIIAVLVLTDVVQSRYQKKLLSQKGSGTP